VGPEFGVGAGRGTWNGQDPVTTTVSAMAGLPPLLYDLHRAVGLLEDGSSDATHSTAVVPVPSENDQVGVDLGRVRSDSLGRLAVGERRFHGEAGSLPASAGRPEGTLEAIGRLDRHQFGGAQGWSAANSLVDDGEQMERGVVLACDFDGFLDGRPGLVAAVGRDENGAVH